MTRVSRPALLPAFQSRLREKDPTPKLKFMPGEMLIKIKPKHVSHLHAGMSARSISSATLAAVPDSISGPMEYLQNNMGLKAITPLFASSAPQAAAGVRVAAARAKASALASVVHSEDSALSGINLAKVDEKSLTPARMK